MKGSHEAEKNINNSHRPTRLAILIICAAVLFILVSVLLIKHFDLHLFENTVDESFPQNQISISEFRASFIEDADTLAAGYFYDEAIARINEFPAAIANEETDAKILEYTALKNSLVKYEGKYYHLFFHSLIIDTDLAFDSKGHSASGYNSWMATQSEFIKMLPLLLENDFVLYNITDPRRICRREGRSKGYLSARGQKTSRHLDRRCELLRLYEARRVCRPARCR